MLWADGGPLLLVDDSASERMIARECMQLAKFPLPYEELSSADALLEYLGEAERGQRARPAIVLLDLNMPGKNGFDALTELRRMEGLQQLPVIVVTNSQNPSDRERALSLGASGYLVKPRKLRDYVGFFVSLASGGFLDDQ